MLDLRNQTLNDEATESKPKEQKKVCIISFYVLLTHTCTCAQEYVECLQTACKMYIYEKVNLLKKICYSFFLLPY